MSTNNAPQARVDAGSLSSLQLVGVVLAAISGVLHLYLAALFVPSPMGLSFVVAGVGFLAGCAAVVADYRRPLVYLLGIPFTLGQVVAWYVVNAPDFSVLGYVDKAAQVGLIAVLVVLYRRES
ncbi:hypothetical protein CK500_13615 [Halorubrum salipaludis]|uniref:Uncharacterized protein n=1 Tax=Halorubrum salipaludis TaxID=2032630 RepID=A0A2A2FCR8_9EURY|nr:hypothetical protein [Halorubrum salipaludis]PAU82630.1 hypothetical protein CK500_13615 [Halorubrum salipaludis]